MAYPSPAPQSSSPFAFPAHVPAANNLTSPNRTGDVVIFDTISLQPVNVIEAHKSPLSVISFNNDGTLLATASDKGTIVRVFSVPTATKLYQFRRGTYPSRIFSINFNLSSSLLAVSSATETVHIFRLARPGNIQASSYPTTRSESAYDSSLVKGKGHKKNGSSASEESTNQPFQHRANSTSSVDSGGSSSSVSSILPHLSNRESHVAELDAVVNSKSQGNNAGGSSNGKRPSVSGVGGMASILRRGSRSIGKHVAGAVGTYLPTAVTEMWEPQRDFAFVKLPNGTGGRSSGTSGNGRSNGGSGAGVGSAGGSGGSGSVKSVVAFNAESTRVFVVTSEGYFYQYEIDLGKGGEGTMLQQYSLFDNSDE